MTNPSRESDRRQTRRLHGEEHGIRTVRIRPGHAARIIDASAGGVLLETGHRLLPGKPVELHMEAENDQLKMRGRVVRCAVVQVRAATVFYRGAIVFDRHLPWFAGADGYPVPGAEQHLGHTGRAAATRPVV